MIHDDVVYVDGVVRGRSYMSEVPPSKKVVYFKVHLDKLIMLRVVYTTIQQHQTNNCN